MARFAPQAGAIAVRAVLGTQVLGQLFAHALGFRLAIPPLQIRQDAFEGVGALDDVAAVIEIAEVDALAPGAAEYRLAMLVIEALEGDVEAEAIVTRQRAEHLEVIDVASVPAADGAFAEAEFLVDHPAGVEELLHAQTVAGRAGAGGVVEGKQLGLQLADGEAADRAGEACGEDDLLTLLAFHGRDDGDVVGQLQCRLEGFGQALLEVLAHLESIHHHLDGVLLLLVELGQLVHLVQPSVDADADETLGTQLLEHRQVLTLALAHDGGEQHQPLAFRHGQHLVDHLADGLGFQGHIVLRAARRTHAGIEQAQIVVDLGDGAHGGARIVRGGLLLDGNRWRQAFDGVHIGLFHHRQELAGVGRQGFHVPALAFGIEGVERQRRLAGAGQSGDDDELVPGKG